MIVLIELITRRGYVDKGAFESREYWDYSKLAVCYRKIMIVYVDKLK